MKAYINQDVLIGIFFLIIVVFFFTLTSNLIPEAATFPIVVAILLFIFAILIIKTGLKRKEFKGDGDDESKLTSSLLKTPLLTFSGVVLYCLFITLIGFFPSTVIFIIAYLYINNYRSLKTMIITVISVVFFVYLLFVYQLNVRLPAGILFE